MTASEHRTWVDTESRLSRAKCACGWIGQRHLIKVTIDKPTPARAFETAESAALEEAEAHESDAVL